MKRTALAIILIIVIALLVVAWFYLSNSTQNPLISNNEAISIATPYINQYATEYNRTVTNVTATFHTDWGTRPVWDVFGGYDRTNITGGQYWIIGYEVVVYADNGQIDYKQAYGVM